MSSSQDIWHSRRSGKAPEKSNFAQTCNLLSQYLKEKRTLSLENIAGKLEGTGSPEMSRSTTTRNLLANNNMEKSGATWTQHMKSIDLFPQYAEVGCSSATEDAINKATPSCKAAGMEPKTAQMTIFYGGQVLVLDDFPADKAREVMLIASKGSSPPNSTGSVSTSASNIIPNSGSNAAHECLQPPQSQAIISSDLPIARRASLHRFFEKRKDRVAARAPYQLHNPSTASPKHEGQLELKL